MCSATSGNVASKSATLVRVPVAISHGVPLGCASRASRIARIAFLSVTGGLVACGKSSVPPSPDSPSKERLTAYQYTKKLYPTMDIRSIDSRSTERLGASRIHRNIRTANSLENTSCVLGGVLQRRIAMHCRNPQQVQRWMMRGNQNRKCILHALGH